MGSQRETLRRMGMNSASAIVRAGDALDSPEPGIGAGSSDGSLPGHGAIRARGRIFNAALAAPRYPLGSQPRWCD